MLSLFLRGRRRATPAVVRTRWRLPAAAPRARDRADVKHAHRHSQFHLNRLVLDRQCDSFFVSEWRLLVMSTSDKGMLKRNSCSIPSRVASHAQLGYQVLRMLRHGLRVFEAIKVFHKLLHLQLVDAFVPDWVPAGKQVEQDDAAGPDVGLLSVSEHVCHLLGWLVQKGATLGEVGDRV